VGGWGAGRCHFGGPQSNSTAETARGTNRCRLFPKPTACRRSEFNSQAIGGPFCDRCDTNRGTDGEPSAWERVEPLTLSQALSAPTPPSNLHAAAEPRAECHLFRPLSALRPARDCACRIAAGSVGGHGTSGRPGRCRRKNAENGR